MTYRQWFVCRFCQRDGWDSEVVKYGRRHYAHFACYLDAGKPLAKLRPWQINQFPYRVILERGLGETVEALTKGKV